MKLLRRSAGNRKRLQPATFLEPPRHVRDITVEETVVAVFRHVDDAARLMHRAGLVFEAAHSLDGHGFCEAGLPGGNLEDVAVLLVAVHQPAARQVGAGILETFLAG